MKQLLTLPVLLATAALANTAQAQDLTNNGTTIALTGGAILFVPGNVTNTASGSVLDLSSGANNLYVGGNLVNASASTLAAGTNSLITLNGAAAQQLDLQGAALANLTINNTNGGVTLPANSNTDVTGALTLTSGMVMTALSSNLRLLDGATLTGEQSGRYVQGNLVAVKANVPAGATTAFPNSFSLTPTTSATNLTVARKAGFNAAQTSYGTNASGSNKGIDRIWQASAPVAGTVQMSWLPENDNGLTSSLNSATAWARTAAPVSGSNWTPISGAQNASSSRTVTGTASSAFSFFTVSTTAAPLPVTLVAFTAARAGDAALLKWTTASELNNDYFDVEMSVDGMTFRKIGQVAGHGTSTTANTYELTDPRLLAYAADPVYYRLRQVDNSGTSAFSPVRTVRVEGTLAFALAAYPNPLGISGTHLQVRTGFTGSLTLAAYDATGRLVFSHPADLQPGTNAIELPEAGSLATGVYYLKASQAGQSAVLKLTRE